MRRVRQGLVVIVAMTAVLTAALAGAAAARAVDITRQGVTDRPFTFESVPVTLELAADLDGGQDLRLAVTTLERIGPSSPVYGGTTPDPRSVDVLANGHLLITDRNSALIAEVTRAGEPVWTYSRDDDPALQHPFSAQRFSRDGRDLTLIADRWAKRVWVVDAQRNVMWQYGVTDEKGVAVDHLADPFYARYSAAGGGTVLIADCNEGGNRVIEIRYADYQTGVPDHGFTDASIIWAYGTPGVEGTAPGLLDKPHCAQRLDNGNVLITDADGARVIEVDRASKQIVWHYGVTGEPGASPGHLADPNYATRLSDGDTLIVDTGNRRVLRVGADAEVDAAYDLVTESRPPWATSTDQPDPRAAAYTAGGLLAVADTQFTQIALLGYGGSAQASSLPLDCGKPGITKAFVRLTWKGDTGLSGTKIGVDYRLDGGAWHACTGISSSRAFDFPAGTTGKTIAYRVRLGSTARGHTPTLDSITIQSTRATTGGGGGGGGGSGVYAYPALAVGGTGSSGIGTGAGDSGTGSGSGSSGAGAAGAGDDSSSAASALRAPVSSMGAGVAQSVRGYQVEGEEGVSGVPLRAAEGAQAPQPESSAPGVPVLVLVVAGLAVIAAFLVPWPFAAARIRAIAGFDHVRPRQQRPFWPLDP